MSAVWDNAPTNGSELLLLLALADYADDEGWCWPTIPALAKKSRMTERGTYQVLASLRDSGMVETVPGKGRRTTRRVCVEKLQSPW